MTEATTTNTVKVGDTFVLRAEYIPYDNSMNVLAQFGGSAVDLIEISDQPYPSPGGGYSRFYKFLAVRPGLQVIEFASYNPSTFVLTPTMLYQYSVVTA